MMSKHDKLKPAGGCWDGGGTENYRNVVVIFCSSKYNLAIFDLKSCLPRVSHEPETYSQ